MIDESLFAFAGLWEQWRDPAGGVVETCTILTTVPNGLVSSIHNRMPAILRPEDYELWLDPGVQDPVRVGDCLRSFDTKFMKKYPISARVNSTGNDDPRMRERDCSVGLYTNAVLKNRPCRVNTSAIRYESFLESKNLLRIINFINHRLSRNLI
jgi:hypothetical protein